MVVLIIIVVLVAIVIALIVMRNNLVVARQRVKNAWSQIDVQLQRRFDLIPNLVETVKGYMAHESDVLEKVTSLRSSWTNAKTVEDKASIDSSLSSTLKTIMALSENYPDLKANTNFMNLQDELSKTEDKLSYSRQFYNDTVTKYNTQWEVFPSNIAAGLFGFKPEALFEVNNAEARKNVKVDFGK